MDSFKESVKDDSVDVKSLIYKFLGRWYLFVICLSISLTIAYFVNTLTQPIYEVKTSILVKNEQSMLDSRFSSGLGMYNNQFKITNEIGIIKSYKMTQRALEHLNFTVEYYQVNRFNEVELYKSSPFQVVLDTAFAQPVNLNFNVEFTSADEFIIQSTGENINKFNYSTNHYSGGISKLNFVQEGKLFSKIKNDDFAFTLIPQQNVDRSSFIGKKLYFKLYPKESIINKYRYFNVYDDKSSSIITLTQRGNNVPKLVDFLNSISNEYLKKGIERKNLIAENTVKFIDTQLGEISDSLKFSESRLQNYRSENKVMNMEFQAQQAITSLENLQNQRAEIFVKAKYYDYLKEYLNANNTGQELVAPSALGIEDPVLGSLITELTRLFNDRSEIQYNSKKDNPYLSSIEMRIKNMKRSMAETIDNLVNATQISLQEIDDRIAVVSEKVNKLPETQRKLFGFERKFKLNDALYTYLLTKRSEMQISKASYLPDNEIIDVARDSEYTPISPNRKRNNMIALFLGLGIPLAFILLLDFLNDKVQLSEDIEAITDFPILGHIIRNKEKVHTIAHDSPMCLTSESIRSIRTNFQFISNEKSKHVVLITSSMMNEGKSFVCLNLALSFALNNKKCIVLSFDLRKPKISEYLGIDYDIGISSFLSTEMSIDEIIIPTKYNNLDVILSGPTPPNPMELISGEKSKELFKKLKERYDFIFVDTPPVGMVADALILLKYSDINIYVIRHNFTLKKVFSSVIQNFRKRGINNMNIVINDVHIGKRYLAYSQGYAYNYGYGYGYGYYSEESHKSKSTSKGAKKTKKNFIMELLSKTKIW